MRRLLLIASLVVVASLEVGCGAAEEETPVEQKEEEAGLEEVEEVAPEEEASVEEVASEPTPEEIQAEGCPEGQVSNEAGTECYPAEEKERAQEEMERKREEYQRAQTEERVRRYEAGELGTAKVLYPECLMNKAALKGGQELANRLADEAVARATPETKADDEKGVELWREVFAEEGIECTMPETAVTPAPEALDKAFEKPAADPKALEIQCSPQSNAAPAFREKYC